MIVLVFADVHDNYHLEEFEKIPSNGHVLTGIIATSATVQHFTGHI